MDPFSDIVSAVQTGWGIVTGAHNMWAQQEANRRNEALMRESWARDDTAYQRKVKDLKAAGLSPAVAYGGAGAGNSSVVRIEPEEWKGNPLQEGAGTYVALQRMRADISKTAAEEAYIEQQIARGAVQASVEAAVAGNRIERDNLDTVVARETTPDAIEAFRARARRDGTEALTAELSRQIRVMDVKESSIQLARSAIALKAAEHGLSQAEADALAAWIAVKERSYNLDRWQSLGLPTNGGMDIFSRAAMAGTNVGAGPLMDLVSKLPRVPGRYHGLADVDKIRAYWERQRRLEDSARRRVSESVVPNMRAQRGGD